uniref:Uncharacterized protein n=1 Tax=uncultured marine virus TaxID=186617 RepID=A0A0F7L4A8_9VIRU|nr:hypothetical protein [uncultured marine virus]
MGRGRADWHQIWYVYSPLTFLCRTTTLKLLSHFWSKELHQTTLTFQKNYIGFLLFCIS